MRIRAKWLVAMFAASVAFGVLGCQPELPEAPKAVGQAAQTASGIEVSVVSFNIEEPDFIDRGTKEAMRPATATPVAVLRLKIRNTSDAPKTYKPLHNGADGGNRVLICTDPGIEHSEGDPDPRVFVNYIKFEKQVQTPSQVVHPVTLAPGEEIIDEYLFEKPVDGIGQLVMLIPTKVMFSEGVKDPKDAKNIKSLRILLPPVEEIKPVPPSGINAPAVVDGIEMTVTRVVQEYAEIAPVTPPATKLKYPYGYTTTPVMSVYVTIKNTSDKATSYNPSHTMPVSGINMRMSGGLALKRVKLKSGELGKGQQPGAIEIKPGEQIEDVFFFETPSSESKLDFNVSGHILGVRGIYRFELNYAPSNPPLPDFEPYKKGEAAAEEGDTAPAENEDAPEQDE